MSKLNNKKNKTVMGHNNHNHSQNIQDKKYMNIG
jgi:hypothetical protein